MDCREAREQIVESLVELPSEAQAALEDHLAGCETCRRYSELHLELDRQLSIAISAPPLDPRFRKSVMKKVRRESVSVWPEYLPDASHLAGCACATAVCIPVLPFPTGSTLLAGLTFTLVTYVVQSVLRGALEMWDEG